MQKRDLWIFRIVTGLFSVMMVGGASMYFMQNDQVREAFTNLGYPTFIIYPLAIAKLLGLVAIWTNKSPMLKEWAYAGFVFELLLGIGAHLAVQGRQDVRRAGTGRRVPTHLGVGPEGLLPMVRDVDHRDGLDGRPAGDPVEESHRVFSRGGPRSPSARARARPPSPPASPGRRRTARAPGRPASRRSRPPGSGRS